MGNTGLEFLYMITVVTTCVKVISIYSPVFSFLSALVRDTQTLN